MDGTQHILASADPVQSTPGEPEQVDGRFLLAVVLLVVLPIFIVLPAAYVLPFFACLAPFPPPTSLLRGARGMRRSSRGAGFGLPAFEVGLGEDIR